MIFGKNRVNTFYDNDIDAYIPELWANESLAILEENMVMANLVHRDFSEEVKDYGDTVNTRRPAKFTAKRKTADDEVEDQNATATNVAVLLNQLSHVSFVIKDAQASKSFKDLVNEFLRPAMLAEAKLVDQVLIGQYAGFLGNSVGNLGGLTESTVKGYMLDARARMNTNLAPENTRNLIWNSTSETSALKNELFISAQQVGDGGTALKNATLGRKLGFDNYMSQNMASVADSGTTIRTGAVNNGAGYAAATTVVVVDGFTGTITGNQWITIDGIPYRVVSSTATSGNATGITIGAPGLRAAVADNAVIRVFDIGAVNLTAGYASGWAKDIVLDGFASGKFPAVGQMLTFGTTYTNANYVVVQSDATAGTVLLDRPLDSALSDNDAANPGPTGSINFGFHRNAIALVSRPLALPPNGLGGQGAVVNYNNISMRAVLSYDGKKQGVRVTLDMLFGAKVLDTNLGVVMLG